MRLLIDTTAINVGKRPLTGIPRVVHNYLKFGYSFGAEQGIEVLPVCMVDGTLVLQRASDLFPAPPGHGLGRRRRGTRALLLLGAFGTAFGLAHVPYGLAWVALFLRPPAGPGSRTRRATRALSGALHSLKAPARYFWSAYMRQATVSPQPQDVFFAPAYWHDIDPAVLRGVADKMAASFVLVHDIIPVTHPQYYHAPWRDEFRENVGAALTSFSAVLAISNATAQSIRHCYPAQSARAVLTVAHNGYEPLPTGGAVRDALARVFGDGPAPWLMVGTIEPKKGHLDVLHALRALKSKGLAARRLIVLGRKGWMYDAIVAELRKAEAEGLAVWSDDATDAELAFAYRNAHLLIQSSQDEGFGLPMVEAASNGCPVVARRSPISQEVLGDCGLYFDTVEELGAILAEMETAGAFEAQRAVMQKFDWPAWQEVVPAVFQALLDHARGHPLPPTIQPRR